MAISKKRIRKIVVEDQVFYWKFNEKVFVYKEENENSLLIIDFGYYDIWLYAGKENNPPDFEPKIVTPKFVRDSILFALNCGWNESKINIEFKNSEYRKIDQN